jgi:hypothetical protein
VENEYCAYGYFPRALSLQRQRQRLAHVPFISVCSRLIGNLRRFVHKRYLAARY